MLKAVSVLYWRNLAQDGAALRVQEQYKLISTVFQLASLSPVFIASKLSKHIFPTSILLVCHFQGRFGSYDVTSGLKKQNVNCQCDLKGLTAKSTVQDLTSDDF